MKYIADLFRLRPSRLATWELWVAGILGILSLGLGIVLMVDVLEDQRALDSRGEFADAVVVEVYDDDAARVQIPDIKGAFGTVEALQYPADVGDTVRVKYDPQNPSNMVEVGHSLVGLTLTVMVVFLLVGVVTWFRIAELIGRLTGRRIRQPQ